MDKFADENKTRLARIMKLKREELGMTRNDLSKAAGITVAAVGLYENAKREPTLSVIIQIATALHTSIDALVGYSVEGMPEYERYKRYLESIGASVRESGDGGVIVTLPSKENHIAYFPNVDDFLDVMRISEEKAIAAQENARKEYILRALQDYSGSMRFALAIADWKAKNDPAMQVDGGKYYKHPDGYVEAASRSAIDTIIRGDYSKQSTVQWENIE